MRKLINLIAACIVSVFATLGVVYALTPLMPSIPFTFVTGTVINPAQMNANFQAVQNSMNAIQLNGSVTLVDASGGGVGFNLNSSAYTRVGNMVFVYAHIAYGPNVDTHVATIGGLPVNFTSGPNSSGTQCFITWTAAGGVAYLFPQPGSATVQFMNSSGTALLNNQMIGLETIFECIYPTQ